MNLRPYQIESVDKIAHALRVNKRVLFILPTGGGKTVVFSEIAKRATDKGKTVLILTDRLELFEQASRAVLKHEIPICRVNADSKSIFPFAKLFIGMVQTVSRRLPTLTGLNPDIIICDEAHKGNFFKIMNHWGESMVIGATATPINKRLHAYYTDMVNVIDIPELVAQGYLSPCKAFQMQDDMSDLVIDKTGEFTDASLMAHYNKSNLYEGLIEKWLEKCKGKKTVVFNVNIEHSKLTTAAFNAAGIKSYNITSDTPEKEREWILSEFTAGNFPVLNNCGILTTGWDEPSLEVVCLNRATTSLALFLQMCGRGSRTFLGKEFFMVLDFGRNHDRHGLWCEKRNWTLEPPKKKKKPSGVAPIRECKSCGAILPAQQKLCEFCGHEITPAEKELLKGELVEIVPKELVGRTVKDIDIDDLAILHTNKVYNPNYIFRILRSRGEDAIKKFAEIKGFKYGWVTHQVGVMQQEAENGGTSFINSTIKQRTV